MKLLVAIVSLISILGCALGAVFDQQALVFQHFGGREDGLICGNNLVLQVPNSTLSTKAKLTLNEIGNNFEYRVSGKAAIAISSNGWNITNWMMVNDWSKPMLKIGDIVLLVVENDAAGMVNMLEFVRAVFVNGSIQQNVIDSNKSFSIAAYKVSSKHEPQPRNYPQLTKSVNYDVFFTKVPSYGYDDVSFTKEPSSYGHDDVSFTKVPSYGHDDVSFTKVPSSYGYEPFVLECIGGWNGEKKFIMQPRSISLAIEGFKVDDPPSTLDLEVKGSKLTVSRSGYAMVCLIRGGESHLVLPTKNTPDLVAGDIVLFNVWNQGAKEHEMTELLSTAINNGVINKELFAMGENHVIMAFKISPADVLLHEQCKGPVETLTHGDEFAQDQKTLVLELIGGDSSERQLVSSPSYASLILPAFSNFENPSKIEMTLNGGRLGLNIAGNALVVVQHTELLMSIFEPKELPRTSFVAAGAIIRLATWKQDMAGEKMTTQVLHAIRNNKTNCEAFKITSFRVASGKGKKRDDSKRKRERVKDQTMEDQTMEEFGPRPTKFCAIMPVRLAVANMSSEFPGFYELEDAFFSVNVALDSGRSNFVNIKVLKENKIRAALKSNAYLFVIRNEQIIHWILPGEYCEISGSLKEQDTVAIFIHNSASQSDRVEIKAGNPFLNGTFNNLLIAGYEYLSLEVR